MSGFSNFVESSFRGFSELFGAPVNTYCRLETADSSHTLVADDGSLITFIRLEGSLKHVGAEEHQTIKEGLTERIQSMLASGGHLIQVSFSFDPESSDIRLRDLIEPSMISSRNLGLDLDSIFEDDISVLKKYCALENSFLILWTRAQILPDTMKKKAMQNRVAAQKSVPLVPKTQNVCRAIVELRDAHSGFVTAVLDSIKQLGLYAYTLTAHESLFEVRYAIDPEFTSRRWKALLPGDPLPLRMPEADTSKHMLLQNVIYPALKDQLWPREGQQISRQHIRIGDRVYGPLMVTLHPQNPRPFQELFRSLARREERLPWRISFLIRPAGSMLLKSILSGLLAFASSQNKRLNVAIDKQRKLALLGATSVFYNISLCTWARITTTEAEAHQLLKRRTAELAKAVQAWGTCDVSEVVGDPLLGVSATLPAMMPTSPAPTAAPPLDHAVSMLPIYRPASPWREGSLILRTQDGKIIPFAPNSSAQTAWVDLGVAPMGAGKSVFLNKFNFAFVTQAGQSRLPWLSIIDVGPSSSGLINLLKVSLPQHQKYLAAYHRLRMTPEFSINPFDLPLGNRTPLPAHRIFLQNFLTLLSTPPNALAAEDGVPGLLLAAIEVAYNDLADGNHPKLYESTASLELHEKILTYDLQLTLDAHTAWWEIVDAFFKAGHTHEALQAQRYAVPLLSDIAATINQNDGLRQTYGEELCAKVWRYLMEAISQYVILKHPTQFDLGDAQVVSLDLDEVAPRGGAQADRQAAVMYMLARHVLGSRFFLMPDDVKLMPHDYQRYHAERIEAIREDPKRLCYDEAHRVTQNAAVAGQMVADIQTMIRESRKWNLSIGMYSQSIEDYPDIIIELATTILILGSGTEKNISMLQERFGLNGATTYALSRLGKPGPAGANFVGVFKTSAGMSQLILTLSLGGQSLWAFSTTTEDTSIRNNLYARLGVEKTLQTLAKRFPGGSAKEEVERRKRLVTDASDADEAVQNVIHQVADELYKEAIV